MEWIQKHGYHFLHLLDPDRVFYRQVWLCRFLKDSLCIETFKYHADEILADTVGKVRNLTQAVIGL